MKTLNCLTLTLLASLSCSTLAAVKIDTITLKDNLVIFTTIPAKPDTGLGCVDSQQKNSWASSVDTYAGRAFYTMLVTAVSSNLNVEIDSAGDCKDAANIERPALIRIAAYTSVAMGKSLYLYDGAGKTKLGKIVEVLENDKVLYLSPTDNTTFKTYEKFAVSGSEYIYFTEENCVGTATVAERNLIGHNKFFNNGKYFRSANTSNGLQWYSKLNVGGTCTNIGMKWGNGFALDLSYSVEVCGNSPCAFKEE
ncbi:hypothetical protein [Pseudoalteromonas denitrificans]|uniref:Uncharacterized protein n=1 Tax=Pseudoalteromonas denitrificans DSM 6059 TaxID=1123010 RepID=A0A1I1U3A0_9GAMM|nr:hypothetical protein [Pseudoalteromonas denitrificans]SFD65165.1 hypothetical protein SAMN02745724_05096 [Pseudoalteromonas denitrificans DSM 6059]